MDSCVEAASDSILHLPDAQQQPLFSAWLPPSVGLCKINADGVLFTSRKQAGIGVVIRDGEGRLLAALCRKIKAPFMALEVEAKAYEAGMLLARHLGLRDGVLEGPEIGVVNFSHVRRIGNKPAHILARQAQNLVNDVIWIEEIPYCIQQALI
ncbi:uncharacterized protein LOC126696242 [Quercus robur]|uniref:uncharacterized protein LOC126696242 n=1 Tax=Quercus robur TaxID=38942 RepID=UPI002161CFEC|nr:uncharacterized protein LOC126696242 [Quercus robur]